MAHEENCLLYPIGNAQECGNTVQTLINTPELFTKLSLNGYQTAVNMSSSIGYVTNISQAIGKVMEKIDAV